MPLSLAFFLITVWCLLALGFLVVGRWMLIPGLYLPNFSWCPPMVYEHTFGLRCSRCPFGRRYLWVCVAVEFYRCRLFDFWTFFFSLFCLFANFIFGNKVALYSTSVMYYCQIVVTAIVWIVNIWDYWHRFQYVDLSNALFVIAFTSNPPPPLVCTKRGCSYVGDEEVFFKPFHFFLAQGVVYWIVFHS